MEQLKESLEESIKLEYSWADSWQEEDCHHVFSDRFLHKMEKITAVAEHDYVSWGRFRITRMTACLLIIVIVMLLAGCGLLVHQAIIHWDTTRNVQNGTMDITFDVEDPEGQLVDQGLRKPKTPSNYTIMEETPEKETVTVEYFNRDDGTAISYVQDTGVSAGGLSIDNDDNSFTRTSVHGWQGYMSEKNKDVFIIWSDGIYLYTLSGNCNIDILWQMADSLY